MLFGFPTFLETPIYAGGPLPPKRYTHKNLYRFLGAYSVDLGFRTPNLEERQNYMSFVGLWLRSFPCCQLLGWGTCGRNVTRPK